MYEQGPSGHQFAFRLPLFILRKRQDMGPIGKAPFLYFVSRESIYQGISNALFTG